MKSLQLRSFTGFIVTLVGTLIFTGAIGSAFYRKNTEANTPLQPTVITKAATKSATTTTASAGTQSKPASVVLSTIKASSTNDSQPVDACSASNAKIVSPSASFTNPGVFISDSEATYQVHGYKTDQINNQMFNCGPIIDGGHYAASTDYAVNWSFTLFGNETSCGIKDVAVAMNIMQVYPNWQQTGASSTVSGSWNGFIANLRTHENGHAQINRSYAQKIADKLSSIQASNCEAADDIASKTVLQLLNELDHANEHYDDETHHGETQGASL